MQKVTSEILLRSGNKIPSIGFGTYQIAGLACLNAVTEALACGYTHIDTASVYKN